jgi:hypothetical protein
LHGAFEVSVELEWLRQALLVKGAVKFGVEVAEPENAIALMYFPVKRGEQSDFTDAEASQLF